MLVASKCLEGKLIGIEGLRPLTKIARILENVEMYAVLYYTVLYCVQVHLTSLAELQKSLAHGCKPWVTTFPGL